MKGVPDGRPLVVLGVLLSLASTAEAGGPLSLCAPDVPFLWPDGGIAIPFNPDQGALGILSNADATAAVEAAFQAWANVETSSVAYRNVGPIPVDVDDSNFFSFLFPGIEDGLSPIVFDDDGAIFELLFGPESGILGFAGPDALDAASCAITEGAAFLNGPAIDTLEGLLDLMVHEFGHYTNLAHTVVNGQIFIGDDTGPTPDSDFFGPPPLPGDDDFDVIETMYPFLFIGIDQVSRTPHRDDIAILSTLYPEPAFSATTGTIRGTITVRGIELSGVNVIARNLSDPFHDAASAISGDFTQGAPPNGIYTINGLTPGATYAVYVDAILQGGFSTPPRLALPGVEEFHNADESDSDDPLAFDGVMAAAGAPSTGIDIIFNPFQPNTPLPVGEDGAVEVFLPFAFRMCGQRFDSVFINANGNLTFGTPDFQFLENVAEFLGGPPRVAGLWRDLSPFNLDTGAPQGTVSFAETRRSFTVHWERAPEFPDVGSNSFAITLHRLLGIIEIETGDLTAANGLVGISCGGAVTSQFETESDLSDFLESRRCGKNTACLPVAKPAVFELFAGDDHDLERTRLLGATLPFFDRFEPNNDLKHAKRIGLPFSTLAEKRFTEIRPAGQDVDYFRVRKLREGQTLIAETLSGQIDSVLGIFDAGGNLLAADDDGGLGVLSRVELEIPADGTYFVAVGTFPDFDFSGDGNTDPTFGVGRYVLDVQAY
jgi:hypothetical protein